MDDTKEIVLDSDDKAATYVKNIEGWVSRLGHFYGKDERLARYDGSTHTKCEECGSMIEKNRIHCDRCFDISTKKKYDAMEKIEYDYETPLYSNSMEKFFWDIDELYCYLEDQDEEMGDEYQIKLDDLQLVICKKEYAFVVEPNELYQDILPEDMDLADVLPELDKAFEELNKKIRECQKDGQQLSWFPDNKVPIFKKIDIEALSKFEKGFRV